MHAVQGVPQYRQYHGKAYVCEWGFNFDKLADVGKFTRRSPQRHNTILIPRFSIITSLIGYDGQCDKLERTTGSVTARRRRLEFRSYYNACESRDPVGPH